MRRLGTGRVTAGEMSAFMGLETTFQKQSEIICFVICSLNKVVLSIYMGIICGIAACELAKYRDF